MICSSFVLKKSKWRTMVYSLLTNPMPDNQPMVLVVDDNETMRKLLVLDLSRDPRLRVEQARTGEEGLQKAVSPDCAVIVLDMILPDTDGLQFIERLKELRADPPSVIAI